MPASLNDTPSGERIHIGLFGCRNAGKSSLINALTGQSLAIVSACKGTTTDPVSKAMELLPLGPVLLTDTPGMDDASTLGQARIEKARQVLRHADIALLVIDASCGATPFDRALLTEIQQRKIPYLVIYNKIDLVPGFIVPEKVKDHAITVSANKGTGINELKEKMAHLAGRTKAQPLLADLVPEHALVVLVIPCDGSAPKGRLILPQQQTIRELLDAHCQVVAVQVEELPGIIDMLSTKIALVVTDSQVFGKVSQIVPRQIPLTSFSILFARYKGQLETFVEGALALKSLADNDPVLISEGCTHHRQCADIGTVKLPGWIRRFTGAAPSFSFTSGNTFPSALNSYKLIIHCGGCMLNAQEMHYRLQLAQKETIPMTNYGIAIAYMHGILPRVLKPFPHILAKLK